MKEPGKSELPPTLLEFKNALHYGFNTLSANAYPPIIQKEKAKSDHLSSQDQRFTRCTSQNISPSALTPRSKQDISKMGLTIDDDGNVLIANWKNGRIQGKYYLFKSCILGDSRMANEFEGICQYGQMANGILQGDNYLYNCDGTIVKSSFTKGTIGQKCFVHRLRKTNQIALQQIEAQCEIIFLSDNQAKSDRVPQETKLRIPHLQHFKQNKLQNSDKNRVFERTTLVDPIRFLISMVQQFDHGQEQKGSQQPHYFQHISLGQSQQFIGFLHSFSKKHPGNSSEECNFDGFGIVLQDLWPLKYGSFLKGKLDKLGRRYRTSMKFQDGYFQNDQLLQGFIFDYHKKKIQYGYSSILQEEQPKYHEFIISEQCDLNQVQVISQYKKNFHLKSLNFTNNYFPHPHLVNRSPWPYKIIALLDQNNQIKQVLRQYDENQIYSVSRTRNKTQGRQAKQLPQTMDRGGFLDKSLKSQKIKRGIENCLNQSREKKQKDIFQRNISEYHRIQTARTTIDQQSSERQEVKSPLTNRSKLYYADSSPTQRKDSILKLKQPRATQDLNQLLKSYRQCKNQKLTLQAQIKSNKQKGTLTARKSPLKSLKTGTDNQISRTCLSKRLTATPSNSQSRTPTLHQIYKQYLKT